MPQKSLLLEHMLLETSFARPARGCCQGSVARSRVGADRLTKCSQVLTPSVKSLGRALIQTWLYYYYAVTITTNLREAEKRPWHIGRDPVCQLSPPCQDPAGGDDRTPTKCVAEGKVQKRCNLIPAEAAASRPHHPPASGHPIGN